MTDTELAAKLRQWKPPFHDTAGVSFLALAADRIEALAAENKVLRKSLYRWGGIVGRETVAMAKEYDALATERDAAVARAAELEAGLKPFVSAPPDPADNMLYAVYVTGAALRRAAELLAGEGGGR